MRPEYQHCADVSRCTGPGGISSAGPRLGRTPCIPLASHGLEQWVYSACAGLPHCPVLEPSVLVSQHWAQSCAPDKLATCRMGLGGPEEYSSWCRSLVDWRSPLSFHAKG